MKPHPLSRAMTAGTPVRILDVRTPGEFENRHIPEGGMVVLVCQSGQRANRAACDTETIVRRLIAADKAGRQ
jgi:rhodanese-related sulfurtransferase